MELEVLNISGKGTGKKVKLDKDIFGIEPNDHAIYLDVKQYLANQRQGTSKTKERADITGSTRKIKRQKGTGTARAGSIKSPIFRGGGRAFGPRPRNYSFKLNKKLKAIARNSALSYKAKEKGISVVEDFSFEAPKTKEYLNMLNKLSLADKKTLLVLPENNNNIYLSSRNIQRAKVITAENLTTYDVINSDNLMFLESSIEKVEQLLTVKK
jgi:large subunit ribosomal protein L4